jgi:hypothetical protein
MTGENCEIKSLTTCTPHKWDSSDRIKNQLVGARGMYGKEHTHTHPAFSLGNLTQKPPGTPGCRWHNNIKTVLTDIRSEGEAWINLTQNKIKSRAFRNSAMNLLLPHNTRNLLTSSAATCCSLIISHIISTRYTGLHTDQVFHIPQGRSQTGGSPF